MGRRHARLAALLALDPAGCGDPPSCACLAYSELAATGTTGYRVLDIASGVLRHFTFPADEHAPVTSLYLVSADELVFETWNTGNTMHRLYVVDPVSLPLVP